MVITWSCGTCSANGFPSREAMAEHRTVNHPDLVAGAVAFAQVLANGGSDEDAAAAEEAAIRDYQKQVQA